MVHHRRDGKIAAIMLPGDPRSVLVVGHPGHELRVYGWMWNTRPVVHVLTDGSGSDRLPRIDSTTALLAKVGATRGAIFGRISDRDVYTAILTGRHAPFLALAEELAASFVADGVSAVVGDAVEGFNPSHDVCRYIINAAVRLAASAGATIACYAFPLDGAPDAGPDALRATALRIDLDEPLLARKLEAAHAYAELRGEVEAALYRFGTAPFRTEWLWPADLTDRYGWDPVQVPYYERYGARRVASGAYDRLVTFRDHVQPLADALWCHSAIAV